MHPSSHARRAGDTLFVRLTRKLADQIDGVDLTGRSVGDRFYLPGHEAQLLIAEGWAEPAAEVPLSSPHLDAFERIG